MQLYGYTMTIDDGPGLWGGYGEQMALLPGTNLHKVPSDIPAVELTMFEPLASAVNWVQRVGVQLGDTVVVQGPGHQGLACVMAARAAGATIAREPGETSWGGYNGVFHDPDGHAWEIAHNPFWALEPDGSIRVG